MAPNSCTCCLAPAIMWGGSVASNDLKHSYSLSVVMETKHRFPFHRQDTHGAPQSVISLRPGHWCECTDAPAHAGDKAHEAQGEPRHPPEDKGRSCQDKPGQWLRMGYATFTSQHHGQHMEGHPLAPCPMRRHIVTPTQGSEVRTQTQKSPQQLPASKDQRVPRTSQGCTWTHAGPPSQASSWEASKRSRSPYSTHQSLEGTTPPAAWHGWVTSEPIQPALRSTFLHWGLFPKVAHQPVIQPPHGCGSHTLGLAN